MGGTMGLSITLANSIIGVGILAMPFCFQQCGVLLASLILLSMGLVSRLCCYFLLKSAILARRRNFEFLAFHVFGPAGKLAVEIGIIGFLMGTCIAYFVVVGDLGPQIIAKMFNINQSDILRTSIMVVVSLVCVLPLGLLRNVDSLSNVSAATIGFYFCLVIKVIAEAAYQLPSGQWQNIELWKPSGVLQCVPIFSMALFCQTQLFEIFESLPSLTLEKMNVVTKNAINICTSVYFTLGLFGFIAFNSKEVSGNILMSLSPTMASDVIKLGFVMSVAFSFPLIIFPCRASLYSLLYKKVHSSQHDHIINHSIPQTTFRCITVGIIAVTLFISLLIPNIELVLGLVGSTIGVLICVVFPAACFVNVTFKNTNERVLAKGVLILGLIIMVLGTYANLQAAESKLDKYDDRFITQERIDKMVEDFFEKRGKSDDFKPKKEPLNLGLQQINNIVKDSEVQPPNPEPPESNSNEAKLSQNVEVKHIDTNIKNDNDILLPEKLKEEAADKASETHPKNLNKIVDSKQINGDTNADKTIEKPKDVKLPTHEDIKNDKNELIKQQKLIETMKQHGEEQKELIQEQKEILEEYVKNKQESDAKAVEEKQEHKQDISLKQQQLIETIKQHGQEQKELMKEQKEILDEIIKTKKEIQQNKDVENNEAKKIAVESIKQIANMAIQSLGGVTEKPEDKEEVKKAELLEQLTNEAVQEIAKKAVETIEAIQEIKEKPETGIKINNVEKTLETNKASEIKPVNVEPQKPIQIQQNVNPQVQPPKPIQSQQNVNLKVQPPIRNEPAPVPQKPIQNQQNVPNVNLQNPSIAKIPAVPEISDANKPHFHSADEPQSYKLGEETENKDIENKIIQNIPLALAMNGQAQEQKANALQAENIRKLEANKPLEVKQVENVNKIVPELPRQKREVVDCTKMFALEAADKKICESLINPRKQDILPKVDLNEGLSRLSLDMHIGRSLKSYDENNER